MRAMQRRVSPLTPIITLLLLVMGGCQTSRPLQASGNPTYINLYRSGAYNEAFEAAKAVPTTAHGSERLIAGMSLAAMGRGSEAKTWLSPLTNSADKNIRGRAEATLGLIYADEEQHSEAARFLQSASDDLAGPMKGWAAHYGAQEFGFAGDNMRAERMRTVSELRGPGAVPTADLGQFTVQLGSFSSRSLAQSRVRATSSTAEKAGLDLPRVELTIAGDRPLYAVRVGRFETSADAKQASQRFSGDTAVIRTN